MFSPLLVPCDDPEIVRAASLSGADVLVLDLGAPDAPGDRAARRRAAVDALLRRRGGGDGARSGATPERLRASTIVRVAPLASGLLDADLDAVMAGAPGAVLLPGAVGARDLQHLGAKLAVREAERGLAAGRTGIVAMAADTAAGVLALGTLPGASPRLMALGWDPAALAAALGVGPGGSALWTARDLLLTAAAAAGVPAIDCGPAGDGGAEASDAARRDGFAGKLLRCARPPAPVPDRDRQG